MGNTGQTVVCSVGGAPGHFPAPQLLRPQPANAAAHLDDIIIDTNTWAEHMQQVAVVLESLR